MRKRVPSQSKTEHGVFIILTAFLLAAVFLILLSIVGLGMAISNRIKLQNLANLTSLGAVEAWTSDPTSSVSTRRQAAFTAANRVLGVPDAPLLSLSSEQLSLNPSQTNANALDFVYYAKDSSLALPALVQSNCGTAATDYPCLLRNAGAIANGTLITIKNNSLWSTPFQKFAGGVGISTKAESLSSTSNRCIMFAVDASLSVAEFNFKGAYTYTGPTIIEYRACALQNTRPVQDCLDSVLQRFATPGDLFVYSAEAVEKPPGTLMGKAECDSLTFSKADTQNEERRIYCSMINSKPPLGPRLSRTIMTAGGPASLPFTPGEYYREDYRKLFTKDGKGYYVNVRVSPDNGFNGAEPWYGLMSAINSIVQNLRNEVTSVDRVGMFMFDDAIRGLSHLTADLDSFLQLTNPLNRGTTAIDPNNTLQSPVLYPNFVSQEWFPVEGSSTDVLSALYTLLGEFSDTSHCPADAQRIAVIATDGIMNVHNDGTGRLGGYQDFFLARQELVHSDILQRLQEGRVNVVVLQFGAGGPHIRNVLSSDGSHYLSPQELIKLGVKHYNWGSTSLNPGMAVPPFVFDTISGGPASLDTEDSEEEAAWDEMQIDPEGHPFHGSLGALFDLATVYCPLIAGTSARSAADKTAGTCGADYVLDSDKRCKLKDSTRQLNQRETRALYQESFQEQAVSCLSEVLKNVPFELNSMPTHQVVCPNCN